MSFHGKRRKQVRVGAPKRVQTLGRELLAATLIPEYEKFFRKFLHRRTVLNDSPLQENLIESGLSNTLKRPRNMDTNALKLQIDHANRRIQRYYFRSV